MKLLAVLSVALVATTAMASDYPDYYSEGIQEGQNIRTYNHSTGRSRDITVDSISEYGGTTTIDTYDHDTGDYGTIEVETPPKPSEFGLDATEWY